MDNAMLQKPIQELALSNEFKVMAVRHHFRTLQDILNWPVSVLLMHEGFTQHHYQELRNFLIERDSLQMLKPADQG